MTERLDRLFEQLAAAPADRSLDFLDVEVGRAIGKRRSDARTASALAPIRVASIGLTLAMGVIAGGVSTAAATGAPRQPGAFPVAASLAPSTLLDGGR